MVLEIVAAILFCVVVGGGCVILWKKEIIGKNAKICALGMEKTGKTLFFNALRGIYNVQPDVTSETKVEAFKLILHNSKGEEVIIKLKETQDISGSGDFVATRYQELIQDSTHVIYFCNISEYLTKDDVKREVNARLDLIKMYVKDTDKVFIVLSYGDMVEDRKEALKNFIAAINDKSFAQFSKRMAIVNMTKEEEVKELINSIFYVD